MTLDRRTLKWLWIVPLALLALGAVGFVVWGLTPLGPTDEALKALASDSEVKVEQAAGGWAFAPPSTEPTTGFVLYPGGHVDARSYAPLAREIARRGYRVVVPKMPLALAFLDVNAADKAAETYPGVETWAVGGHSLGGVAAASYLAKHADQIKGLVLYASYPAGGTDFAASQLAVASKTGTRDGVVNRQNLEASYAHLPPGSDIAPIEGGNHAQFGSYGPQPGDNDATIPAADQQRIAADATQRVLERAASGP